MPSRRSKPSRRRLPIPLKTRQADRRAKRRGCEPWLQIRKRACEGLHAANAGIGYYPALLAHLLILTGRLRRKCPHLKVPPLDTANHRPLCSWGPAFDLDPGDNSQARPSAPGAASPGARDMGCTQYLVYPAASGSWKARLKSREAGPYASRDLALRVAIVEALHLRNTDRRVRITVEDARGHVCAEHCLCRRFL
jgi:hypothetical protein